MHKPCMHIIFVLVSKVLLDHGLICCGHGVFYGLSMEARASKHVPRPSALPSIIPCARARPLVFVTRGRGFAAKEVGKGGFPDLF